MTRRGTEAAVLVPIEQWRRLQIQARRSAKDLQDFKNVDLELFNPFGPTK